MKERALHLKVNMVWRAEDSTQSRKQNLHLEPFPSRV
jgi:hypothetical protein